MVWRLVFRCGRSQWGCIGRRRRSAAKSGVMVAGGAIVLLQPM